MHYTGPSESNKIRKLGDIISDLEELVEELCEEHDLQHGDILALVKNYLDVHYPGHIEEYEDGTVPVRYYGHKKYLKKYLK